LLLVVSTPISGTEKSWSIAVLGAENDVRLPAVAEAMEFWNEQLASSNVRLRLGPITRLDPQIPDEVLRQMTEKGWAPWSKQLNAIGGDVIVALFRCRPHFARRAADA